MHVGDDFAQTQNNYAITQAASGEVPSKWDSLPHQMFKMLILLCGPNQSTCIDPIEGTCYPDAGSEESLRHMQREAFNGPSGDSQDIGEGGESSVNSGGLVY